MKLSLVLGGGGAKGSYQVGAIKALNEYNLLSDLDMVIGTSIGAFNACLVMEQLTFEEMFNIWKQIDNHLMYNRETRYKEDKLGIFNQTKMYNILVNMQNPNNIINSPIKGYAVACKIENTSLLSQIKKDNMEEITFCLNEQKDPHKAVLASSSIPIVFGPTLIDDLYYVDGGVLNNLPVNVALENKSNVIILISLDPIKDINKYYNNNIIINLSPPNKLSKTFLGALDFDEQTMQERIDYGYSHTKKVLDKLILEEVIVNGKININKTGIYNYEFD